MPSSRASDGDVQKDACPLPVAQLRLSRVVFTAALIGVLVCALGFFLEGKMGFEKTATKLVMPVGILWLLLGGVAAQSLMRHRLLLAFPICVAWLAFTAVSTSPLSDACIAILETQETVYRPDIDRGLDVLVVLGGGTSRGPDRAQAGQSGDRVVYAAQLFLGGHAKRLITTGDSMDGMAGQRTSPQEHTIEIWEGLGIERASIGTLRGLNTYQEIESLKALMPELSGQRVGLLTSAYHLPRAMRLARAQGLQDLIPVAADYQSSFESYTFSNFIPNAACLDEFARCQHEFMASFLGR